LKNFEVSQHRLEVFSQDGTKHLGFDINELHYGEFLGAYPFKKADRQISRTPVI
jgi:hypothetical protein